MDITFEQLPQAVSRLAAKLDRIEQLLQNQNLPATQEKDVFINLNDAGVFLNLAKATIYGLVSAGKIPYMKQGKKLYFSKQELTNWLMQGRREVKEDLNTIVDNAIISSKRKLR